MAETKKDELTAFDAFVETWGVKYDKAVETQGRWRRPRPICGDILLARTWTNIRLIRMAS